MAEKILVEDSLTEKMVKQSINTLNNSFEEDYTDLGFVLPI